MTDNQIVEPHLTRRFEINKQIGSGAYGVVWKVTDRRTRKIQALKKNFDAFQNSIDAQRTYRQISILLKCRHPHIIQLKQVLRSHNDKDVYLLFEYMDIDLYTLIRENMLGETHKRYVIYQVGKALHYLHTAGLVHRDIKPSNVLVNEDCVAKLCDFGLIRSLEDGQDERTPVLTEYIATRWYRAPEILLGSRKYCQAVDVWSFGCMLAEVLRGKPMFPGNSTLNQIERVLTWTGPPNIHDLQSLRTDFGKQMLDILSKIKPLSRKEWLPNCPPQAVDLIAKTLQFNPAKRPTILQVLTHPYLKQFYNKQEIIQSENKIRAQISDNTKLTLEQYRNLIYKIAKQTENTEDSQLAAERKESVATPDPNKPTPNNRFHTITRSASKPKDKSAPKPKDPLPKHDPLLTKTRHQSNGTKYAKTEQPQDPRNFSCKRKKSDNVMKYHTAQKKKKSLTLYDGKRGSEMLAKYMYENRKI